MYGLLVVKVWRAVTDPIILQIVCQKLHENEIIWILGKDVPGAPPGSANGVSITM